MCDVQKTRDDLERNHREAEEHRLRTLDFAIVMDRSVWVEVPGGEVALGIRVNSAEQASMAIRGAGYEPLGIPVLRAHGVGTRDETAYGVWLCAARRVWP